MKKFLAVLLSVLMLFALVGCANNGGNTPTGGDTPAEDGGKQKLLFFAIGNLGDMGINDLGHQAAVKIANDYDMELTVVEGTSDASVRETSILDALETGDYDYCLSGSWYIQDVVLQNYANYPDTKIVFYDTAPTADFSPYPNAYGISFRQDEGSFLTAVYQCLMTKTGKVGAIANQDSPILNDFVTGWIDGVKWYNDNYNANIEYRLAYMTATDAPSDYECAKLLYGNGYDIVYNIAGFVGLSCAQACEEEGGLANERYMVGVDYDQWTVFTSTDANALGIDTVATSMEKKITDSCYNALKDIIDGKAEMGNHRYTLAQGGVGLSYNEHYKELTPDEIEAEVAKVEAGIKDGSIKVHSYFDLASYEEFAEFRDNPASRLQ